MAKTYTDYLQEILNAQEKEKEARLEAKGKRKKKDDLEDKY